VFTESTFEGAPPISQNGTAANRSFLIHEPASVWLVESGLLDIFLVPIVDGQPSGARQHVMRVVAGEVIFGFPEQDAGSRTALIAVGNSTTHVREIRLDRIAEPEASGEPSLTAVTLIEGWITRLSEASVPRTRPKKYTTMEAGKQVQPFHDTTFVCLRNPLWTNLTKGSAAFLGNSHLPVAEGAFFPLAPSTWIDVTGGSTVEPTDTATTLKLDPELRGLALFHRTIFAALKLQQAELEQNEQERLRKRHLADARQIRSSLRRLSLPLAKRLQRIEKLDKDSDPLIAASQLVGEVLNIEMRGLAASTTNTISSDPVRDIARASNVRFRKVLLRGNWWREEHGPLLGFLQEDKKPVALIPTGKGGYELHDPVDSSVVAVNADTALQLEPFSYTFYRPFQKKKLSAKDLLVFAAQLGRSELQTVFFTGLAGGLLGLVTPIFTGMFFDTVIPAAQRDQLLELTVLLLVAAIATGLFEMTRSLALLRLEGKMGSTIQAAVWDRLLSLPVSFFRRYNAGDLSDRANGIDSIRAALTGTVTNSIVSGIFSVFNLALMFYYSWKLACVALGLIAIAAGATIFFGLMQIAEYRKLTKIAGWLSGQVLQFVSGIAKFRVSGTESRAFGTWSRGYSRLRISGIKSRSVSNNFNVFNTFLLAAGPMAIFFTVDYWVDRITAGDFLAFNAAFGQMFVATMTLAGAVIQVMTLVPMFERATPILESAPEVDEARADPGELTGEIEVSRVIFRYQADGPIILNDISFRIEPGQFVAFVGPSGCGKSTLLRLLLGFEKPDAGAVYYGSQELQTLDVAGVRRQMGVVLQNSTLFRGDIFSNIIGSKPLTMDDAWDAARLCGLDADIQKMPMGMHTIVSEGGGGLSGGQRQRLMIARAIVSKPRILFFDEATSALDNKTQAIVSRSLEGLKATRVVIAHRLSTVVNADRIFVFNEGALVQSGTYTELMAEGGLFTELAKRQLA
jgi:NHLM bacteriocin system ABC transporter ATP-binding protein